MRHARGVSNGQIKAVIFDMDGVLTDSEPLINAAAVAMFQELGVAVQPEDFVPFIGTGENRYLGGVAEKYHVSLDLARAKARTYEIYLARVATELRAFPGAQDLVHLCQRAGLKIALASSADRIKIEANLHQIGLPPPRWDAIVCAEDVVHKKPAPDIFLAAARKLGLAADQCVVVEDAVNGIQAAKAAGMWCVAVAQSFPPSRLTEADLVREKISDLTLSDLRARPHDGPGGGSLPGAGGEPSAWPDAPPLHSRAPRPWGFWTTAGLSGVILLAYFASQVVPVALAVLLKLGGGSRFSLDDFFSNGLFLSVVTAFSGPVAVVLTFFFARMQRGVTYEESLGLRPIPLETMLRWALLMLGVSVLSDCLAIALHRPLVRPWMEQVYATAFFVPLLLTVFLVVVPVTEELIFRGFMLTGFARSRVGPTGAVLLTTLPWAGFHLQFDQPAALGTIVLSGLLLGYIRLRSRSLYPCVLAHGLMNGLTTLELVFKVHVLDPLPR